MLGAMVLGVLAASKSPNAANAMILGGQAIGAQTQLNFSRDMEREADRIGFGVASQAGFAPQGFVSMFAKLQQSSRLNDYGNFPYLRSHPLTSERMADMQSRIGLPDALPASPSPSSAAKASLRANVQEIDHAMVAARARVLSNNTAEALRNWALETAPPLLAKLSAAQRAGTLYGATLAAIKLRDYAPAQALWLQLTETVRKDAAAARLARLLGVELKLAQADGAGALQMLRSKEAATSTTSAADKASRVELFLAVQAQLLLSPDSLVTITQNLQTWVAEYPHDAQAWQWLASAYEAQGRTLGAIRAQAEAHVAQLDYPAALTRFKTAQEWARKGGAGTDHFEASIVDTRARQVEALVKEQAQEH